MTDHALLATTFVGVVRQAPHTPIVGEHPTREEIAQLAYHLYKTRGRHDGYETEDWMRAEQELRKQGRYH